MNTAGNRRPSALQSKRGKCGLGHDETEHLLSCDLDMKWAKENLLILNWMHVTIHYTRVYRLMKLKQAMCQCQSCGSLYWVSLEQQQHEVHMLTLYRHTNLDSGHPKVAFLAHQQNPL